MLIAKIIVIMCFLFSVCIIITTYFYLHSHKKKKNTKVSSSDNQEKQKRNSLKLLFQIKDINKGIIKTINDGYRLILSISSPDFELLTDEEQENFENSLMQFSLSLNFPVQFFTTTLKVETQRPAAVLNDVILSEDSAVSEELKEYSRKLQRKLQDMEREESFVRRSYCIVPVDGMNDKKRAINEINSRTQTVASGLKRANMNVAALNSEKVLQLLHDILNKGSNVKIDELIGENGGVLELYSQGIGGALNVEVNEKGYTA